MTEPAALRRNIELKARCRDLSVAERAAHSLGAEPRGVLVQTDTYFHVPQGRLKLREDASGRAELIGYARADSVEFRGSDYNVVPVAHPAEMKATLTRALGVRGEVRKRRTLYLWHNVRIHLDDVERLGQFLEFEAVMESDSDDAESLERLRILALALDVRDADRIAQSYSDLLGI